MRLLKILTGTVAAALLVTVPLTAERSTAAHSVAPNSSCSSSSPCLEWDNIKDGSGVKGTSTKGNGLVGVTTAKSNSFTHHAGVEGIDSATLSFENSGVIGISTKGNGVTGLGSGITVSAITSSGDGVLGVGSRLSGVHGMIETNDTSRLNAGVFGEDLTPGTQSSGVRGESSSGLGVRGNSTDSNGVQGTTQSLNASGVYGEAIFSRGGGIGVAGGGAVDSVGVLADNVGTTSPALYVHGYTATGCGATCNPVIIAASEFMNLMSL